MDKTRFCMITIATVALLWLAQGVLLPGIGSSSVATEADSGDSQQDESDGPTGFWGILKAGGPVGLVILVLSIGTVALVVEHLMTIRESVLIPPGLGDDVRARLSEGQLGQAQQRCHQEPSFLACVLQAGLAESDGGWPAVEKAVEDATADQSARLFRKIEYLSVIGNIAPMLGLLGTVIGMIIAFRNVAGTQGDSARAADLAKGIYQALVTTVEGLIVAIPSLAAFAVFRNRVDQLVAEVTYVAQHVFTPMKRARVTSPPPRPSGPQPPPVGGP